MKARENQSAALPKVPLTPAEAGEVEDQAARVDAALELLRTERRALQIGAVFSVVLIGWVTEPVGVGILFGMLMAFTAEPVYEWVKARTRRPALSALFTVGLGVVAVAGTLVVLGLLFATQGATLGRKLLALVPAAQKEGGFASRFDPWLSPLHLSSTEILDKIRAGASGIAARAASVAEAVAAQTATMILALFFAFTTMHLFLRHWELIARRAREVLPLRPEYTTALFEGFKRVGRTTLFGTIMTGGAQGIFATLGYWIAGVPEPLFFGAVTAVASLVPAVGTLLVWVPAGIILLVTGHIGRGIFELVWGAVVVVGISDYVLRPRLVRGEEELPSLITFAALFGGVEAFGLKGLVLGPIVISLAIAVLRLYGREMAARRQALAGVPTRPV